MDERYYETSAELHERNPRGECELPTMDTNELEAIFDPPVTISIKTLSKKKAVHAVWRPRTEEQKARRNAIRKPETEEQKARRYTATVLRRAKARLSANNFPAAGL